MKIRLSNSEGTIELENMYGTQTAEEVLTQFDGLVKKFMPNAGGMLLPMEGDLPEPFEVEKFRKLCVEYGELRHALATTQDAEDSSGFNILKNRCSAAWAEIVKAEVELK